jgi:carbamoylphosphate synthase small subunit
VVGIEGIDTGRWSAICGRGRLPRYHFERNVKPKVLVERAKKAGAMAGRGFGERSDLRNALRLEARRHGGPGPRVALMDFGVKYNIMNSLAAHGCDVTVFPAKTSFRRFKMAFNPDGIMLSNGPGDPAAVTYAIDTFAENRCRPQRSGTSTPIPCSGSVSASPDWDWPWGAKPTSSSSATGGPTTRSRT